MSEISPKLSQFLDYYDQNFPRLRLWSLIVTLFGDAIEPRGGVFRLGALQKIVEHIGIENNALRTAMSRLASDGWLKRQRIGRASYYQPSTIASQQNMQASKVIYDYCSCEWEGQWLFAIATNSDGFDLAARKKLHEMNFAFAGRKLAIAPDTGDKNEPCGMEEVTCFIASQVRGAKIEDLLPGIDFHINCDDAYRDFSKMCSVVSNLFPQNQKLNGLDAIVLRLIIIHTWRRIVLKDLHWPLSLRSKNWPGRNARHDLHRIYLQLLPQSENWLSNVDSTPEGLLPPCNIDLTKRFS